LWVGIPILTSACQDRNPDPQVREKTVLDTKTQALLQEIFRREGQSFLLYVYDSFPWTTSQGEPALRRLRELIAAERAALTALGRFLMRHRVPLPFVGSYPVSFTSFNFMSLDHLVPRVIDAERRLLADLERDLGSVSDPAARAELTKLADLKRQNLKELGALMPLAHQPEAPAREAALAGASG
jgi:hypothetical protein